MFKLIALCVFVVAASAFSCQPTIQGTQYNLNPLISPNGAWNFTAPFNGTNWTFQIQLCGPVDPQPVAACNPNSAVNMISSDEKECISLGDSNVYAWDTVFNI